VLTGASGVSPEMALRPSKCLGRSPESWMAMQYSHDLWRARQQVDLSRVAKARLTAAGSVGGRSSRLNHRKVLFSS